MIKAISRMKRGERGIVVSVGSSGALRRRIIDMGFTPGAVVIMKKIAPLGDPMQICIRGYELSIRKSEGDEITVDIGEGKE